MNDPSQANAEAGPSRLPYDATHPANQPSTPLKPPPPPSLPVEDPSGAAPIAAAAAATAPASGGGARGPTIVPTRLCTDGISELPQQFENCQVDDLITLIASMLDRLMTHNDRIPLTPTGLTRFHSRAPPSINVRDYLLRIARYTNVEPCCLLILLPYVDKVCANMTTFTISSLTVHRFIIAGVSVGSKALSDSFCTNGRYARVGGVSIAEMNLLEKEFCEAIDWRLTTTGTVLAHYYTSLVTAHPAYRLATAPLPPPPKPQPPTSVATPALAQKIPLPTDSPNGDEQSRRSSMMSAASGDVSMEDGDAEESDTMDSLSAPNGTSSSSISPSTSASASAGSSIHSPRGRPGPSPSITALSQVDPSPPTQRRPSSSSAIPSHVVEPPQSTVRTASPALIPPPTAKRLATASNLPSPVRGATDEGVQPNPLEGLSFAKLAASEDGGQEQQQRWRGSSSSSVGSGGYSTSAPRLSMSMSPRSSGVAKRAAAEALDRGDGPREKERRAGSQGQGWSSPRGGTAATERMGEVVM